MNKFLVDDKGVLLLVMFGLPPVYHLDDPVRGADYCSLGVLMAYQEKQADLYLDDLV